MNKIKLLYDVARTMRAKEKVDGILTARVSKNQEEVFSLRNEFGKKSTGEAATKVSCELNLDGSRVKRERVPSSAEQATAGVAGDSLASFFGTTTARRNVVDSRVFSPGFPVPWAS